MIRVVLFTVLWGMLSAGPSVMAQDYQEGDPRKGEAIYKQHCLRCHGVNGTGEGPEARFLTVPPANFLSDQSRMKADIELLIVIAHGSIFSPMHGWRGQLSESEMWDVLRYIRILAPYKAIARTP